VEKLLPVLMGGTIAIPQRTKLSGDSPDRREKGDWGFIKSLG